METIILPGYSLKNKQWALEVSKHLPDSKVVNWSHWETGTEENNIIDKETPRVLDLVGVRKVNILAKSIGTAIAMEVIKNKPGQVVRLIFCGLPVADLLPGDETYYEPLRTFPASDVLCIQNESDNHGSYKEALRFIQAINPDISMISQPRSDHEYPNYKEFSDHLI